MLLCTVFLTSVNSIASARITNDQKKLLIDEQLQLAAGLIVRGYYKQAINEYNDIIKRFPNSKLVQEAWAQLAYTQSKIGKKEAALDIYKTFFKKYPESSIYFAVRINYARLLASFGVKVKTDAAIKIFSTIISSDTASEQLKEAALFYLAEIYNNTNRKEIAKSIYKTLASKPLNNKNTYRAYALLKTAQLYTENKQQNKSITIYNSLIENNKLKKEIIIEAFQLLAILYTNMKMFDQAADIYERLSARFPKTEQGGQAMYYRLECLYQAKRYGALIEAIDKLLNSPSSLNTEKLYFIKACALQQQAFYAVAYSFFLKVLENEKINSDFYRQAAVQSIICLLKTEKNSQAVATAIKFSNDKFLSQNVKETILSAVAEKTEKNSELISFWKKVISSIEDDELKVWIEYRLALCYEAGREPLKALSCYKNILKSEDGKYIFYVLNGIVSCNLTLENNKEADKYLDRIITEYSHRAVFPNVVLTKIELYLRNNKYEEALNILNKYKNELLESTARPKAVYYSGCLNYILENWDKAEANFKEILSNDSLANREQAESKLYLGLIYIEKNNLKAAESLLAPIIIHEPVKSLKLDRKNGHHPEKTTLSDENSLACKQKSALSYCNDNTILKLGYFFLKVKNYETAEFCFNKLADNNNKEIKQEAFLGLAKSNLAQKNLSLAIKYYKKAAFTISASKTNTILTELGSVLLTDNRDEEAVLIFQKILENPIDSESTVEARMGMARILAKQPDRALMTNRYAMSVFILSKKPRLCVEAMLLSIKLSIQTKKVKEAKKTWNELTKRFPEFLKSKETRETEELIEQIMIKYKTT